MTCFFLKEVLFPHASVNTNGHKSIWNSSSRTSADILPKSEGAKFAHTLYECAFLMRELRASTVHISQHAITLPFAG